jgi:hypothetical protein
MTLHVYLGILAVGLVAIIIILRKESKPNKPSPVDLLNSLEIDENAEDEKKAASTSSSFQHRFNLNDERMKKIEERSAPPVTIVKNNFAPSTHDFEKMIKESALPKQNSADVNSVDKSTKENKPSQETPKGNVST